MTEPTVSGHWLLAKEMDGLPGEWTFPVWSYRAAVLSEGIRTFYEPLAGYRGFMQAAKFVADLAAAGLTEPERPSLHVDMKMWSSCYTAPNGVLPMPTPADRYVGAHAVTITDETSDGYRFRNTWGAEWGDAGYGELSRAYLRRHLTEAWAVRRHFLGPAPYRCIPNTRPDSLTTREGARQARAAVRAAWVDAPAGGRLTIEGNQAAAHQLSGIPDWSRAIAVAWLYMREQKGRRWAIEEWFVGPEHREQGLGGALLRWAVAEAGRLGGSRVMLRTHKADEIRAQLNGWPRLPAQARALTWWPAPPSSAFAAEAAMPVP